MGEEKLQVETAGSIKERDCFFQVVALARIAPPLISCREIKKQFGCSSCLSYSLPARLDVECLFYILQPSIPPLVPSCQAFWKVLVGRCFM
jgi:hypothetical protein